mgnify:CR=1 FL=1|jgi:predicted DNA-binding transcriptional regulator AlpA
MTAATAGLVSMADIARMTGQSRSTVGNWKARHADFPPPASRTSRGPLYDRSDVEAWLQRTGRLDPKVSAAPASGAGGPRVSTALDRNDAGIGVVLLALRSLATEEQWTSVARLAAAGKGGDVGKLACSVLPSVEGLVDWRTWNGRAAELSGLVNEVASLDETRLPKLVDAMVTRCVLNESDVPHQVPRDLVLIPPSVQRLMTGLLRPSAGDVVYQAGPSLGQTIISVAREVREPKGALYLQESTEREAQLTRISLAAHGLAATVASGDVLQKDAFPELRADKVIGTPPWEPKITGLADVAGDPRWLWGEPGANDSYLAWIQHCLYHLSDGGRAVILLPINALFERGKSAVETRRRIVKAGHLEGVVSLPAGAIPGTTVRGVLLVLVKTPQDWEITMLDMSINPDGSSGPEGVPTQERVAHVLEIYREAAEIAPEGGAGDVIYAGANNFSFATIRDIAAHDFVLDPVRYRWEFGPATDADKMAIHFGELRAQLDTLIKACRDADQEVATLRGVDL